MPKRALGSIPALLVLLASRLSAAPCAPSDAALCLNSSRFRVAVHWQDTRGRSGDGQAVSLTADTGYFWFFSPSNIELVVKVLDARPVNGKYWVFFGALSNVQYDLTVTDTATGAVKRYHNAQGQFASVGDTNAFAGSLGAPPTTETMDVAGAVAPPESLAAIQRFIDAPPMAATVTPCKAVGSALGLNGCRFALSVEWTDSHGRTGVGTPVQLTDDTGYFWFFNDANVELVVKVLDARPVNGNFWVFFGALSNVRYTLTVKDELSGAVRTYTNPLGTFGSVGDTAAFRAGRSVSPAPDEARAVFADVDPSGGSLTATGADGTQFVLELPPDALADTVTVRMTPLQRVDGLPLARGFLGGVRLEPEGLKLFVPATLTIRPAQILRHGAVGFSYAGSGQEFAIDVNDVSDTEMRLQIMHFSGYGAGQPGSGDVGTQQSFAPLDPVAAFRQQAMAIVERGRVFWDENFEDVPPELTPEEVHEQLTALMKRFFEEYVLPTLRGLAPECNRDQIVETVTLTNATIHTAGWLGLERDPEITHLEQGALDLLLQILQQCLEKARQDCIAFKDPFRAWDMVLIAREIELLGGSVTAILEEGGPIEDCLRFEFRFDSTITLTRPGITEKRTAHARVPLRIFPSNSVKDVAWYGSDAILLSDISVQLAGCTATDYTLEDGILEVGNEIPAFLMPFNFAGWVSTHAESFLNIKLNVGYNPGSPMDSTFGTCSGVPTDFYGVSSEWRAGFEILHSSEEAFPGSFLARDWEVFGLPGIYARKSYQQSKTVGVNHYTEQTEIIVKHTPDE